MDLKAPRGTADMLPELAWQWEHFNAVAADLFSLYGYKPIDFPLFESSDLFVKGLGEGTDVVGKEMFSVLSKNAMQKMRDGEPLKSDQRLALRPEGTASAVRACIEHNLVPQGNEPAKLYYAGPMFRCERPQKGRMRQFHQIGIECMSASAPSADAEAIIVLLHFFERVGVPKDSMRVLINSMGDDACRPAYREAVREFIKAHGDELCEECNHRAEVNPLRAFDCKNDHCREIMDGAPKISDYLCDDCKEHYAQVKAILDSAEVNYIEDPRLVRGLDYYTRTVFEVQVDNGLGSQNAIGGGGRYDKLFEVSGGKSTPGLGWALGFERTLLAVEAAGNPYTPKSSVDVFIATVASALNNDAFALAEAFRAAGISALIDYQDRSLKSQLKLANKYEVPFCVIMGPDEMAQGNVVIRDMNEHVDQTVELVQAVQYVQAKLEH